MDYIIVQVRTSTKVNRKYPCKTRIFSRAPRMGGCSNDDSKWVELLFQYIIAHMGDQIIYFTPERLFRDLVIKYTPKDLGDLIRILRKAKNKEDREVFFSGILASGFIYIDARDIRVRAFDKDEDVDTEIIDVTIYNQNQQLPKKERKNDVWRIQNVTITEYDFIAAKKKGNTNFYKVISDHLERTKVGKHTADYSGTILHFHFQLQVEGEADVEELRRYIRKVNNNKFTQIWMTSFSSKDYKQCWILEVVQNEGKAIPFPIKVM